MKRAPRGTPLFSPRTAEARDRWGGFVCAALVIDADARRIVGWRVSRTAQAGFVLDALEQALHERRPGRGGLVHHSDRGGQYLALRYTDRLVEAGIEPSVGSVGDSYDNALAETVMGLFKTEVIHRRGPWRSLEAVEFATLEVVDWFNTRRLLGPIDHVPPAEAEAASTQPLRSGTWPRSTQTKWPPENPARFTPPCAAWTRACAWPRRSLPLLRSARNVNARFTTSFNFDPSGRQARQRDRALSRWVGGGAHMKITILDPRTGKQVTIVIDRDGRPCPPKPRLSGLRD